MHLRTIHNSVPSAEYSVQRAEYSVQRAEYSVQRAEYVPRLQLQLSLLACRESCKRQCVDA